MTGALGISPAISRPPEVCASASSGSSPATSPKSACGMTQSRFRRVPPGTYPARTASLAPSISGTAEISRTADTPLALANVNRWPSSPKPVMSVAQCRPLASAARLASAFNVVMTEMTCSNTSPVALCRGIVGEQPGDHLLQFAGRDCARAASAARVLGQPDTRRYGHARNLAGSRLVAPPGAR